MILPFDVNQQTVSRSAVTSIPRKGSREYLYLSFTFSDDWTDLTKTLYVSSETYSDGIIIEEGVPVQVPTYYTQQNSFSITLCGIKGNQFVPTNIVTVLLEESNDTWEEIAPDPESIPYQQLIAMVQKAIESMHAPYITEETKTWMQWSIEQNMFVDTGIVANGQDGVSVTGASIDTSGHLIITLSNGQTIDAGNAKGDKGDPGGAAVNIYTLKYAEPPADPGYWTQETNAELYNALDAIVTAINAGKDVMVFMDVYPNSGYNTIVPCGAQISSGTVRITCTKTDVKSVSYTYDIACARNGHITVSKTKTYNTADDLDDTAYRAPTTDYVVSLISNAIGGIDALIGSGVV